MIVVCLLFFLKNSIFSVPTDTFNSYFVLQGSYKTAFILFSYLLSPLLSISLLSDIISERIGLSHTDLFYPTVHSQRSSSNSTNTTTNAWKCYFKIFEGLFFFFKFRMPFSFPCLLGNFLFILQDPLEILSSW